MGPQLTAQELARLPPAVAATLMRTAVAVVRVTRPGLTVPPGGLLVYVRMDAQVEDLRALAGLMPRPWGWADPGDYGPLS